MVLKNSYYCVLPLDDDAIKTLYTIVNLISV